MNSTSSTPSTFWTADDQGASERRVAGLHANRSFYGWGHRFLWNQELLTEALAGAGFVDIRPCRHGESEIEEFVGIEQHETYPDTEEIPHVLIFEARASLGTGARAKELDSLVESEFLRYR